MIREKFPAIDALGAYDKAVLIEELLAQFEETVRPNPDPEIIAMLRARWEHYLKHPESAISGDELMRKMRTKACAK